MDETTVEDVIVYLCKQFVLVDQTGMHWARSNYYIYTLLVHSTQLHLGVGKYTDMIVGAHPVQLAYSRST